jgi:hypothetical protein
MLTGGFSMTGPTISKDKQEVVIQLRLKGESYAAIGRDARVNLDRRTAKKIFDEWEREHSSFESVQTRQALKRELMSEHVKELLVFARGLARTLDVPEPSDERSGEEVLRAFLESHVRGSDAVVGDYAERDVTKLLVQRNERLYRDFRSHIEATGWWELVCDYLHARDGLLDGRVGLEDHLQTRLTDSIKGHEEVGVRLTERRGLIHRLAKGLSLAFIGACVRCVDVEPVPPMVEQLDSMSRESVRACARCSFHHGRVQVRFAQSEITVTLEGANERSHAAICGAVDSVARELAEGETGKYHLRTLADPLLVMLKCHDRLMAEFHSPRLQSVILDSRCDHCPA